MVNALVLTSYKKKKYVAFVDQIVRSFLLDRNENPELHNLVKLYQIHRHWRTYRKYENEACRFKFAKFFSKEALIVESLLQTFLKELRCWTCAKKRNAS